MRKTADGSPSALVSGAEAGETGTVSQPSIAPAAGASTAGPPGKLPSADFDRLIAPLRADARLRSR